MIEKNFHFCCGILFKVVLVNFFLLDKFIGSLQRLPASKTCVCQISVYYNTSWELLWKGNNNDWSCCFCFLFFVWLSPPINLFWNVFGQMQCYCCVCDSAAPCTHWTRFGSPHCDATDKDEDWRTWGVSKKFVEYKKKLVF